MKRRFIGGPLHGQLRVIPGHCVSIPVRTQRATWDTEFTPSASPSYQEVLYKERTVTGTRSGMSIVVMYPADYTETQFARAFADFVEGVDRNCGEW